LDARLEPLDRAILVADWDLFTGRSKVGSAPWQLKRSALLSDDGILSWVRSALRRSWPFPTRRRLELFERVLLDTQVEQHPDVVRLRSELQHQVVAFRPRWKGKRVNRAVLYEVMRQNPNEADRKRAYYGMEPLYRPLEERLRELVRMRNDRARALGYSTFAEMCLRFQGLSVGRLNELAEAVVEPARSRTGALRDQYFEATGQSEWHPWDISYAREQRVPLPNRLFPQREMFPRIFKAVREWGFRTDRMRFRVVFHDLPAGGLTLAPDPPKDIRILVHPQGGWLPYAVMFHEVGHAAHSASIRAPRHLLRWHENVPGFAGFHEGIAGLFEDIPSTAEWLSAQPGVGRKRAEEFARTAQDSHAIDAAFHAGYLRIEQLLYEHPERDPMPEVVRLERRVFGLDDFAPPSFVDSFFVDTPVYIPNYLLAILFDHQLADTLRDLFGEPYWPNRKVGPWLTRNWFAPGSLYDWVPRVKKITGRPFGAEAFRAAFANA
jgi:peptidyl-dipeptidase A